MNVFGADFGTTYCSMAYMFGNSQPETIPISFGEKPTLLRSAVHFPDEEPQVSKTRTVEDLLIGDEARQLAPTGGRLLQNFKPLLGRKVTRSSLDIEVLKEGADWKDWKWDGLTQALIPKDTEMRVRIVRRAEPIVHIHLFQPWEIELAAQAIFHHLAQQAEKYTGITHPDQVVVGVPAEANDFFRKRIVDAVLAVNWVKERSQVLLVPEPLAIALRYGVNLEEAQTLLVFDYGGGTLDLSCLDIEPATARSPLRVTVRASKQCDKAGMYFDWVLLRDVIGKKQPDWWKKAGFTRVSEVYSNWARGPILLEEVERLKHELSESQEAYLSFPEFGLDVSVTRKDFENAIREHLVEVMELVENVLSRAGVKNASELDAVLLAGGSSKIPVVQLLLGERFGKAVRGEYSGSGTGTEGLVYASRYSEFIRDRLETTYGLWDPERARFVPTLKSGTLLDAVQIPTKEMVVETDEPAELIILEHRADELHPVASARLPDSQAKEISLRFFVDPQTKTLAVYAKVGDHDEVKLNLTYWQETKDRDYPGVPYLEEGNLIKFKNNFYPNYAREGSGLIKEIRHIRTGFKTRLIFGDLFDYVLNVYDYYMRSYIQVRSSNENVTIATVKGEITIAPNPMTFNYRSVPTIKNHYRIREGGAE